MQRIVDYIILENTDRSDLRAAVLELCANGWQPFGSVSSPAVYRATGMYTHIGEAIHIPEQMYCQAMVKYAEAAQ